MPLSYTGRTTQTANDERADVEDNEGLRVTVIASQEAVLNYGWPTINSVASNKYDAGEWQDGESARLVTVNAGDCRTRGV
jgi:hypothetical protein